MLDDDLCFTLPLKVKVSSKSYFIMNMNNYRNGHHRVLSTAKKEFTELFLNMVLPKRKYTKISVHYSLHPASKRKYDTMNVISVVDKFLMDAMQKRGIIEDDNYTIVMWPTVECCAPDKDNPRIEVRVRGL